VEHGLSRLRREKVVLSKLVQEVVNSFKELSIERKISLTQDIGHTNLVIDGDASKIAMALRELVKNALTFSNPGGQVRVKLEQIPGYAKISVIDNGIGIPAREQAKIFQRFYQIEKHLTRKHGSPAFRKAGELAAIRAGTDIAGTNIGRIVFSDRGT